MQQARPSHEKAARKALSGIVAGGFFMQSLDTTVVNTVLSDELAATALAFRYTFIAVGVITLLSAGVFRWLDEARIKAQPRRT
ncbi:MULTISPECIES: hypothetical protein [unclassified Variovorax]|uniref:hypothetical protein n=1 Tax=unclassified Variovorax TaxID=663243 RepID=UPI003F44BCFD